MASSSEDGERQAGYTVTELLVVFSIMALFLTVIPFTYLNYLPRLKMRQATTSVLTELTEARLTAMERRQVVVVQFFQDGHYDIADTEKAGALPEGVATAFLPVNESLQGPANTSLSFFPDGGSTGGEVKLSLGEMNTHIDVHWLTGGIELR